jgi:hypothetical protein
VMLGGGLKDTEIEPVASALLPLLFPANAKEPLPKARARVQKQFLPEYASLKTKFGKPVADSFVDALLTLEAAAQLGEKDEMTIYGITADDSKLAGADFCAFAGFFDRKYREHDYDVGRTEAQKFLKNPGGLGPIRYKPEDIHDIDHDLDGLKLENMDHDIRVAVRDRLRERSHEILKEIGVNPWLIGPAVREAIDLALIKPQLDKLLKL